MFLATVKRKSTVRTFPTNCFSDINFFWFFAPINPLSQKISSKFERKLHVITDIFIFFFGTPFLWINLYIPIKRLKSRSYNHKTPCDFLSIWQIQAAFKWQNALTDTENDVTNLMPGNLAYVKYVRIENHIKRIIEQFWNSYILLILFYCTLVVTSICTRLVHQLEYSCQKL